MNNEELQSYLVVDPETGEIVAKIKRAEYDNYYYDGFVYSHDPRFEYVK